MTPASSPLDVYPWDAGHPIFNTPNSVGMLLQTGADLIMDNGDRVEPDVGASALAGFVSTVSSGQGAIILANDGRTLFNAFMADNMSNVVALLENEILFLAGGNPPNILLISDTHELTGVAPFLAADGHSVTRITNESANGSVNLTNLNFLKTFDMVIWGASGAGNGNLHDPAVHNALENYIQAGGHLLVTGGDTLASPVDTNMADLVRSMTTQDITAGSFTTPSTNHFILNGPAGDFRNTTITPGYTSWDGATADAAAGAISLATVDGQSFDAIIYTDISAGGSVGYWTGGDHGALPSDGKTDWKTPGDSLDILRNWVFGIVGVRADLNITMIRSPEPTHLSQHVAYTLLVINNGPNEATGVLVADTLPSGVFLKSILASQGSYSNAGGVVLFDVGSLPSGGSAMITIDLAPLNYDAFTNHASVVADQTDPYSCNNEAVEVSTILPGIGIDGDFDGIMDWWERQVHPFLETMDATTDLDGDGMLDIDEWRALTDVDDPASTFVLFDLNTDSNRHYVMYWDAAPGREYDIYRSASLFESFQLLEIDLLYPQNSYTDTSHFAGEKNFYRAVVHLEREKNFRVGYYDFSAGNGITEQQASIVAAGHTPYRIYLTSPQEPALIDFFYVQNSFSTSNSAEYLSRLPSIRNAVSNGMSLILHDRAGVALGSTPIMPGGESIPLIYAPSGDINIVHESTRIRDGVGGMLDDTTLDSATHSALGYALESSLPTGAIPILSQTDPTHISTFAYPYGDGWVIYSTILLDFYIGGGGSVPAFTNVYAPNIIDYSVFLAH